MKNKFIDLYPQLVSCEVGDLIIVTKGEPPYFYEGDIGRLYYVECDGSWWANFDGFRNETVYQDGKWCVYYENINFRKYTKNTQKETKITPNTQKL
jgi:hypothetical protein